jgi:hypothetical protein
MTDTIAYYLVISGYLCLIATPISLICGYYWGKANYRRFEGIVYGFLAAAFFALVGYTLAFGAI